MFFTIDIKLGKVDLKEVISWGVELAKIDSKDSLV